jgi:Methyltransferase domain
MTRRHELVAEMSVGGVTVKTIAKERVQVVEGSNDGYHAFGNRWWTDPSCEMGFQFMALDPLYSDGYFACPDHPQRNQARQLYAYMQQVYSAVFGRRFVSVLELGSGGGEITSAFHEDKLDYISVEGTTAGVDRLKSQGIEPARILLHNIKFMPRLNRRFDLVMCTEVAEHIEPFFASKVIDSCISHADAVWFSAADRNRRAHYHHPNEQDPEAWDNIFAHMGFPSFVELNGMLSRAGRLYIREEALRSLRR